MSTPFDVRRTPAFITATDPASAAQLRFIGSLLSGRAWQHSHQTKIVERTAQIATALNLLDGDADGWEINRLLNSCDAAMLTKSGASKMIDWLRDQPVKAAAKPQASSPTGLPREDVVPAGRYAVATDDGAVNELAFYKVDRPTEGRWAGYVFVKHLVGADEQRMSKDASRAIMHKIAEVGAEAASAAYGHEIGKCGVCGRRLTNDDSRERGIGPVCAAKNGW